ncbi:hypothetical protein BDN72DRAFT_883948 [Pluteus cervinus]|uniref:Uncharacterized protein n=1 Tax=Pluteus cervinus TaxID=181527 RepID=A0ACD3A1D1_9AGAR|nr:hypothetical protein BDN72DRAFT_883948 [Pluteus cervinus]
MSLLLFLLLLGARAFPITPGPETTPTIAHTIVWGIEARTDGPGMAERTMLSIVRSCLSTIAACIYRAIHQNIPDPKASWWKRQAIRAKITFYALIAPEAIMGGFGRLDNQRVLYPPTLIELIKNGQIDVKELQQVTDKRIADHSKGDILSKSIIALQTTWFVFECLARLHQGLPLLELEVVTLAFVVLNTLTYAFWWHKPLDVLCPIHLHIQPKLEATRSLLIYESTEMFDKPPPPSSGQVVDLNTTEESVSLLRSSIVEVKEKREVSGVTWQKVVEGIAGAGRCVAGVVETVREGVCAIKNDVQKRPWWKTVWKRLIEGPFLTVVRPLMELFDDCEVHDDATHVSTFYGTKISEGTWRVAGLSCCFIG